MLENTGKSEIFVPHVKPGLKFAFAFFKFMFTDLFIKSPKITKESININPKELKVWMIGHATVLINFYGTTILTDPVFVNNIPPRRLVPIGFKVSDLPKIDLILLSHAHMDHFNIRSLKKLTAELVVIPKNCSDLLKSTKFKNIIELRYDENINFKSIEISAHKMKHWGERFPWQRKDRGYNGYALKKRDKAILFCGDTGYERSLFQKLSDYKPNLVLMPIGAYYPWNDFHKIHLDPKEAIDAFINLGAQHLIPIHWGNFRLSYEPLEEPPNLLMKIAAEKGIESKMHVLHNGQSYSLKT